VSSSAYSFSLESSSFDINIGFKLGLVLLTEIQEFDTMTSQKLRVTLGGHGMIEEYSVVGDAGYDHSAFGVVTRVLRMTAHDQLLTPVSAHLI
jgi:hypothetical protein